MTNQIQTSSESSQEFTIFNFGTHPIRTLQINGEPWFVAVDVCEALNLSDTSKSVAKLREKEKGKTLIPTLGGDQESIVVSESGMYTLVLRCRDAVNEGTTAFLFRVWVTDEVLPQIRKTGQYVPEKSATLTETQAEQLKKAVDARVGKVYARLWGTLNSKFNSESYKDIKNKDFDQALKMIQTMPITDDLQSNQLTEDEMVMVFCAFKSAEKSYKQLEEFSQTALKMIKIAPSLCSLHVDQRSIIKDAEELLAPKIKHMISNNKVSRFLVPYLQS